MSEQVLDLDEFMERVQDDKELLFELLDIFVQDFQVKREQIKEAVEKSDFEVIRSVAHSLKGASGNISAKLMRETFFDLEELGKNNDLTGTDELLSTMNQQFEALNERINQLKEEMKN